MNKAAWLEVSVSVTEEYAEAVADVMARYAPGGVVLGYRDIAPDPDGEGKPCGPLTVRAYLPHDEGLEERRNKLAEALWHLSQIGPVPEPEFRLVEEEDWSLSWRKHYRPFHIGKRLVIIPSWLRGRVPAGRVGLRLDPGMAFGTGTHPTTQLCLEVLEDWQAPGESMIDLGCGSGILAIAAVKLGAGTALGVDIDGQAVSLAQENAKRNRVLRQAQFREGSLADLRGRGESAPMVTANILAVVLRRMLEDGLADIVAPGGRIVLSGILQDQSQDVEAALDKAGLRLEEKRTKEDWVALVARRV